MSVKPGASMAGGLQKPLHGGSFLAGGPGSMRSGAPSGAASKTSNFSKMVSGRAGQSTRKGDKSSGSGRRSRKKKKDDSARVIVDGRDVTPLPLMSAAAAGMGFAQAYPSVGGGTSTADVSHFDASTEHGFGGAFGFGGPSGGSLAHGGVSAMSGDSEHFGTGRDFFDGSLASNAGTGDWAGGLVRAGMQFEYAVDGAAPAPAKAREWTDRELREKITIKIEETETMTLFHLPGLKIWSEDEAESAKALGANATYLACLEKHKEKDKYSARAVQTFNATARDKEVQVAPPAVRSVGVDVTTWDIFDVATKLEGQVTAAGTGGTVPRIQHESDLLARSAVATGAAGGAAATVTTRAEEEEEELAAARAAGEPLGGGRGLMTGASNTPSVHSAQQSFLGGASSAHGAGASFRGGKPADRSWHANLSTATGAGANASHASGTLSSHTGAASASVLDQSKASALGGTGSLAGGGGAVAKAPNPLDRLLNRPSVLRRLRALEQAVVQNGLHEAHLLYRNHPEAAEEAWAAQRAASGPKYEFVKKDEDENTGSSLLPPLSALGGGVSSVGAAEKAAAAAAEVAPSPSQSPAGVSASLIPLWRFSCPLTRGLNVSCLAWNKQNLDLLAAGYGSLEFGHSSRDRFGNAINGIRVPRLPKDGARGDADDASSGAGLILFWSLANPAYPAKVFHTRSSVTSLDFSDEHPHLLAAGMYDGSVAIYDIRDTSSKPALESVHLTGKHAEAVWGVKFVAKDLNKRSQQLTSISTDGSVKQWSMKKGLVPHELMQLKRIPNRAQLQGAAMEGLSREASGMCFDFPINDGTQYFAGTEDGLIHKCSVSYNEQTLENFYGHTGPVYRVRCSPFLPDAFLSCSADWSAMLWSQKSPSKPVLKFAAGGHDYVTDIAWSPNQSCVFGLVSREGRIEIWDLDVSPLDPVIKYFIDEEDDAADANAPPAILSASDAASVLLGTAPRSAAGPVTPAAPKRTLSCMAFSANAPVVLVGTSDGSIELFRLEGTALTSVNPNEDGVLGSADAPLSYGQELNAATVMQVPRDRDRDRDLLAGISSGDVSSSRAALHEEQSRLALELHQANLLKFRDQARKLESIMEQHNDTKNKIAVSATNTSADGANGVVVATAVVSK